MSPPISGKRPVPGLIDDENVWLQMLADRNQTSHTYNEQLADLICDRIKQYAPVMRGTFEKLASRKFPRETISSSTFVIIAINSNIFPR